jgi:hypothetical protein
VKANVKIYVRSNGEGGEEDLTLVDDSQGVSYQIGEGDAVPGESP